MYKKSTLSTKSRVRPLSGSRMFVFRSYTCINDAIYLSDFNQDGKPDNITFMIKRIKVHTLDALKEPSYRFPNNYGVEKYLELFSGEQFIKVELLASENFADGCTY